jgi:hypothetical protein
MSIRVPLFEYDISRNVITFFREMSLEGSKVETVNVKNEVIENTVLASSAEVSKVEETAVSTVSSVAIGNGNTVPVNSQKTPFNAVPYNFNTVPVNSQKTTFNAVPYNFNTVPVNANQTAYNEVPASSIISEQDPPIDVKPVITSPPILSWKQYASWNSETKSNPVYSSTHMNMPQINEKKNAFTNIKRSRVSSTKHPRFFNSIRRTSATPFNSKLVYDSVKHSFFSIPNTSITTTTTTTTTATVSNSESEESSDSKFSDSENSDDFSDMPPLVKDYEFESFETGSTDYIKNLMTAKN